MLNVKEAVRPLLRILDDPIGRVRIYAITALGELADPVAIPFLVMRLKDLNSAVAESASLALMKIGGETAILLVEELLEEMREATRYYALSTLSRMKAQSSYETVINIFNNDNSNWVKSQAAYTLGSLRNVKATDIMINAFSNESDEVRFAIVVALGWLGDNKALSFLQQVSNDDLGSIKDGDERISDAAISSIQSINQKLLDKN